MGKKIPDKRLKRQYAAHLRAVGFETTVANKEAERAVASGGPLGRGYALRQTRHKRQKKPKGIFGPLSWLERGY